MSTTTAPLLATSNFDLFIPDGCSLEKACQRTTHLCIAAHQDDVEIMAFHGIAECYKKSKLWFGAIVATDGAGSPRSGSFANYTDNQMKLVRKIEQRKAAEIGKYSFVYQLGYSSAAIKDNAEEASVNDLTAILTACQPEVVYLHNLADKHHSHTALTLKCITALRRLPVDQRPKQVYGCEVWRNLDWLDDEQKITLRVDQNDELAKKLLSVFESQIAGGKRYDLATIGRRVANATFNEARATDKANALALAMDLNPLLADDQLSPQTFIKQHLDSFTHKVLTQLS